MKRLSELGIETIRREGSWNTEDPGISGIETNSLRITNGDIFFALQGINTHGAEYCPDAMARGASLVITDEDGSKILNRVIQNNKIPTLVCMNLKKILTKMCLIFFPSLPNYLMATTGTNGKTTVVNFTKQFLELKEIPCLSVGTLGVKGPLNIETDLTTPDQVELYKILTKAKDLGINFACIEASSHAIHQGRLDGLEFASILFTNLSQDHLDYHHVMDSYFAAKVSILNTLNNNTKVFVNIDDKYGKNFAETAKIKGFSVETIGFMESADIRIKIFKNSINTNAIEFGQKTRKKISHTNLFGEFQAVNLGLAALACKGFGLSLNEIIDLIPNIKPINGRMEFVGETKSGSQVFIDFAHSPDAMEKLLRVFKKETPAKLILVFGAGGERDKDKRKYMGLVASKLADKVYVTDDNPRNENPALIRKDLIDWCPEAIEVSDRAEAIFRAIKESELGDIVIIAGKGHENVQIIGSQQFPFNDFENASIAIATIKNTEI